MLALAGVAAMVPRRKGPLELAALTAALLIGFELVLTHWFYLYIPWFLPFVALALFLPPERQMSPRRRIAFALAILAATAAGLLVATGVEGGPGITDTPVYRYYGERIADGDLPYRDFRRRVPTWRARRVRRAGAPRRRPARLRRGVCGR